MGRVKQQLIDEQEHDEFMRDQEPDFDDYAKAKLAKDKDDYEEWAKVEEEGEYCQECYHVQRTTDPYGTGDSPTVRECTADNPMECPGVVQ